ncbi:hypothetical protein M0R04_04725 [Candidatus Dojkabacteria bacterium]|jgi:hypothetical protein|nr:hypothetical protein [Candidatus Dojkabacteria bacterium]
MAVKLKEIRKKCSDGEYYTFRNGFAVVPGVTFKGKPVLITLKEFKELDSKMEG